MKGYNPGAFESFQSDSTVVYLYHLSDFRHIPNIEFNFDVRFSALKHLGNAQMGKPSSFVREETYTVLTLPNLAYSTY